MLEQIHKRLTKQKMLVIAIDTQLEMDVKLLVIANEKLVGLNFRVMSVV